MASLKRFETISQCGVFRDFHWLQECAGQPRMRDFADINIIYGWNGTGKSTFSVVPELLRTLVFARPCGGDQFAAGTVSPSLDMSR